MGKAPRQRSVLVDVQEVGVDVGAAVLAGNGVSCRVDLVLVEGFKRGPHPKLEVHRRALGKPLLCPDDPTIVALAADAPVPGLVLPQFALDDVAGIAGFVAAFGRTADPGAAA